MKQVAQNYRTGELTVLDVPVPACRPGGLLVRSLFSLISTGTELMKVGEARLSLVGKAKARPDQVKKVLDAVSQQGALATYQKVINKLDSYTPLGYSLCGAVIEVGDGADEFRVGQIVAAAGNEFALHAGVNWVPTNLCVPVPDSVRPEFAAFSTVGAIAMQGVRQAEPQLGESTCVFGLGLVGQIVVRLLLAAGVRVFGVDPVPERCRLAEKAGAVACHGPDAEGVAALREAIAARTDGHGVDHVILAAGGSSNAPVELAADVLRDRGRVVDIGKCSLDLPWNAYYDKELDLRFSRSYGPGRYDVRYEVDGVDYPLGYVRWTERRNLACFVDLLADQRIDLTPLISGVFPVTDAPAVYDRIRSGQSTGVGFLFDYAASGGIAGAVPLARAAPPTSARAVKAVATSGTVGVGFIGVGNYASSMLLPHLAKDATVNLRHVVTTTSLSAYNAQRRFGFASASTDLDGLLGDDSVDLVFIATRHESHAALACEVLESGKAVFVEKPLALSDEELDQIRATVAATGNTRLMVGFNRRFSPMLTRLHDRWGDHGTPVSAKYLINAGPLAPDSWYRNAALHGSRFVGEGGHFLDTLTWWVDDRPTSVQAVAGPDGEDLHVTVRYAGGSVATVCYDSSGNPKLPKEFFEASAGGRSVRMENFRRASLWTGRRHQSEKSRRIDKGQTAQLAAVVTAVRQGAPMPIDVDSLFVTTALTVAAQRVATTGGTEAL